MINVLITGSNGFVGKNLTGYLGKEIFCVTGLSVRYGTDIDIKETDAIIHLSGKAHDLKNTSDPDSYYEANSLLTQKMFNAFLNSSASVFIFVSSVKAVADSVNGELNEMAVPFPQTHYGKSKRQAEEYIFSKLIPGGKRVYILRPCMIHGPGNKGNLNLLYKLVEKGIPYPLAAFKNKRSFLSVENLCFAIREMILRNDIEPGIYNIADDGTLSTSEVIQIMSSELSKRTKLWAINGSLIKMAASVGDVLRLPLNSERLKKLTEDYIVSNKKIKQALQKPLPVSIEEGIRTTVRSFMRKTVGKGERI